VILRPRFCKHFNSLGTLIVLWRLVYSLHAYICRCKVIQTYRSVHGKLESRSISSRVWATKAFFRSCEWVIVTELEALLVLGRRCHVHDWGVIYANIRGVLDAVRRVHTVGYLGNHWSLAISGFDTNPFCLGDTLVVLILKPVSLLLSRGLLYASLFVLKLLVVEDCLQQVFTTTLVHLEHAFCDDAFDLVLRHMVKQIPVIIVLWLVFHRLVSVFLDVAPLFLGQKLVEECRVFVLNLGNRFNLIFRESLAALELDSHTLHFPIGISLLSFCPSCHEIFEALILLDFSLHNCNWVEIAHCLFKSCISVNIKMRILSKFGW